MSNITEIFFEEGSTIIGRGTTAGSSIPFWGDTPDAWDTVVLAGQPLPGLCTLSGKGYEAKTERTKRSGQKGRTFTYQGDEPAVIDISLKMWTQAHLEEFARILDLIKPRWVTKRVKVGEVQVSISQEPGQDGFKAQGPSSFERRYTKPKYEDHKVKKDPGPVDIYHPALALFRIRSVHVLGCGLPQQGTSGVYEARIHCMEFVDPKADKGEPLTPVASYAQASSSSRQSTTEPARPTKPSTTSAVEP